MIERRVIKGRIVVVMTRRARASAAVEMARLGFPKNVIRQVLGFSPARLAKVLEIAKLWRIAA